MVRAHPLARLRERPQLRRLLDRVGQPGERNHREVSEGRNPQVLADLVRRLSFLDRTERVEYLIEYADQFKNVPERIATRPTRGAARERCESQAFVWAENDDEGTQRYYFAVENPQGISAKSFCAILDEALAGASPEQVQRIPEDFIFDIYGKELSMGKGEGAARHPDGGADVRPPGGRPPAPLAHARDSRPRGDPRVPERAPARSDRGVGRGQDSPRGAHGGDDPGAVAPGRRLRGDGAAGKVPAVHARLGARAGHQPDADRAFQYAPPEAKKQGRTCLRLSLPAGTNCATPTCA